MGKPPSSLGAAPSNWGFCLVVSKSMEIGNVGDDSSRDWDGFCCNIAAIICIAEYYSITVVIVEFTAVRAEFTTVIADFSCCLPALVVSDYFPSSRLLWSLSVLISRFQIRLGTCDQ